MIFFLKPQIYKTSRIKRRARREMYLGDRLRLVGQARFGGKLGFPPCRVEQVLYDEAGGEVSPCIGGVQVGHTIALSGEGSILVGRSVGEEAGA